MSDPKINGKLLSKTIKNTIKRVVALPRLFFAFIGIVYKKIIILYINLIKNLDNTDKKY